MWIPSVPSLWQKQFAHAPWYVTVHSTNTNFTLFSTGKFCGNKISSPIVKPSGNKAFVVFTSDGSNGGQGFSVSWSSKKIEAERKGRVLIFNLKNRWGWQLSSFKLVSLMVRIESIIVYYIRVTRITCPRKYSSIFLRRRGAHDSSM